MRSRIMTTGDVELIIPIHEAENLLVSLRETIEDPDTLTERLIDELESCVEDDEDDFDEEEDDDIGTEDEIIEDEEEDLGGEGNL